MDRECQEWMAQALDAWRSRRVPEALGELLKSQRHRAYSIALRITASPAEAEDAVQDAFIKLMSRTHGFEDQESFELSVYRAVVQCALDAVRKVRRRQTREVPDEIRTFTMGDGHVSGEQVEPEAQVEQEETRAVLRNAVAELSDDERVPLVLCYYQGLSVVQTARTLDVPRETVRARLVRALERLRVTLTRKNEELSAAALVALLWRDGHVAAPASLCSALDKVIPGKACGAIPAAAHAGPLQAVALGATKAGAGVAIMVAAAVLLITSAGIATAWSRHVAPAELNPAAIAEVGPSTLDAPRSQPGSAELKKEDDPVKSKIAAMVLAGGMLVPVALQAAEPNPQVADAIAQIAARRAEKDSANAAAAAARAKAEGHERNTWSGASNPGAPGSAQKR